MNLPLYIAKRYLFSKTSTNAINIITYIATFGVIVVSLALFVILSGFSGLRSFNNVLLNSSEPDITIRPKKGKSFIFSEKISTYLTKDNYVLNYSKIIEERAFLQHKEKQQIAYIKGVSENYHKIIDIDSIIFTGSWLDKDYKNTAVIGNGISYKLSLGILNFEEALQITVPKAGKGFLNANNAFKSENVQVIGIYGGSEEFQNKYAFVDITLAQHLLNFEENEISSIELKVTDPTLIEICKNKLASNLGKNYNILTRAELNATFYKVMNTENFVSYLISTLIVIIALFNVIGAIIMIIIDKKQNLKTLLNLGFSIKEIRKTFVYQGVLLTLFGMITGTIIGLLLIYLQQRFSIFMITRSIPYPVEFSWINLAIVVLTITILGYLASLIASSRINKNFIKE